jgi:uncharacterized membrane protein YheB (UPF0754 family)
LGGKNNGNCHPSKKQLVANCCFFAPAKTNIYMNWWFFLLPLIAACLGWLLASLVIKLFFHPRDPKKIMGFTFQGVIPKRQGAFAIKIGQLSRSLLSISEIEEKITHPDNVKKIMPQAEAHIDNFLRVKLVKSMPVVGMFVGDKTINNLKSLFVTELEQLFPEIMKNYMGRLQEDFNIEKIVTDKIASYPPEEIEKTCLQMMKKELRMIKLTGTLFGFLIGLLQLVFMLLMVH